MLGWLPRRPGRLRVLITQVWMHGRHGTESVTRDLAKQLMAHGHLPTVYTPLIGPTGLELRESGVPVIDDLRSLNVRPDVIHGQHCIPTVEAIVRFPRVPVVNVCHAWVHGVEAPVVMPQVRCHVGVDKACLERLNHTEGIDAKNVRWVPNGVVLSRIPARPAPLPPRPLRVASFGKASMLAPILRELCASLGVEFTEITNEPNPEALLVGIDVVFASARAALEAICAGCAVVVCDARGVAEIATPGNFVALRAMNFGLRSLTRPATAEILRAELARYNPREAAAVSDMARAKSDFERLLARYLKCYRGAIKSMRRRPVSEEEHALALSGFLRDVLPRGLNPAVPMEAIGQDAIGRLLRLTEENAALAQQLAAAAQPSGDAQRP